jgi:protein-histidine pros-kinase
VKETVNTLPERAQTKNLTLLAKVVSQAPQFVRSDPAELRQVLTNVIGNAIKYTDEASMIIRLDATSADDSSGIRLIPM